MVFHENKKLTAEEWVEALEAGKLVNAIKQLSPIQRSGPWYMLCDNESFLNAPESRRMYRKLGIRLWQIPAKSPDLNPIERFWSYLRRRLRAMDLADAAAKKPMMGKSSYIARVRAVIRSAAAQEVAKNIAKGYMKTCEEVIAKNGAASSG